MLMLQLQSTATAVDLVGEHSAADATRSTTTTTIASVTKAMALASMIGKSKNNNKKANNNDEVNSGFDFPIKRNNNIGNNNCNRNCSSFSAISFHLLVVFLINSIPVTVAVILPTLSAASQQQQHPQSDQLLSMEPLETDQTTYPEVHSLAGSTVSLPCNVGHENATLILWWRSPDMTGPPIYSVDGRSQPLDKASHFVAESFTNRLKFDVTKRPAQLIIEKVTGQDDGQFWCRVDFRWSRTIVSTVKLNVIVPPESLKIIDETGDELSESVQLNEGDDVTLTCLSYGGKPVPQLSWQVNGAAIFDSRYLVESPASKPYQLSPKLSSVTLSPVSKSSLINPTSAIRLSIRPVVADDHQSVLACRAVNNNETQPLTATVTIEVNTPPSAINILPPYGEFLSVDVPVEAICRVNGSRPAAEIRWFIGTRDVTDLSKWFSDQDFTQSVLAFSPQPPDNNQQLICRAINKKLKNATIETSYQLEVRYSPITVLSLDVHHNKFNDNSNNNNDNANDPIIGQFNEDTEVRLLCSVDANPPPTRVKWTRNGEDVESGALPGLIVDSASSARHWLVIKSVGRQHTGLYRCEAENQQGRGESRIGKLVVQYAPVCISPPLTLKPSLNETVNITCIVDARPDDVTFTWSINSHRPTRKHRINDGWLQSQLTYTVTSADDYGLIHCWANNRIGRQKVPCLYNIQRPAISRPLPVKSCDYQSNDSAIQVDCLDENVLSDVPDDGWLKGPLKAASSGLNFDGRLYHLEVFDSLRKRLLVNQTSTTPNFVLNNISSGASFLLVISTSSSAGRSPELTVLATTQPKTITNNGNFSVAITGWKNPIIMFLSLVCVVLIVIIFMVIVASKVSNQTSRRVVSTSGSNSSEEMKTTGYFADQLTQLNQFNNNIRSLETFRPDVTEPDVIPISTGTIGSQQSSESTGSYFPVPNGTVPTVNGGINYQQRIKECLRHKHDEGSHVKFLVSDESRLFLRNKTREMNQNQEIVLTIENHPFNNQYSASYSTAV